MHRGGGWGQGREKEVVDAAFDAIVLYFLSGLNIARAHTQVATSLMKSWRQKQWASITLSGSNSSVYCGTQI